MSTDQATTAIETTMVRPRRAMVRVDAFLPARLECPPGHQPGHDAQVFDLGPTGVGLATHADWPVGATVRVRCELPGPVDPVFVDVEAVIRWKSEISTDGTVLARDLLRYGMEFPALDARSEEAMLRAVLLLQAIELRRRRGEPPR